jgi:hypothetical protein
MRYIQHPSNNKVLGAPEGWDQEELPVGALPVTLATVDCQPKLPVMVSFWVPDVAELESIKAGKPIRLWVHGTVHPIVGMDVEP